MHYYCTLNSKWEVELYFDKKYEASSTKKFDRHILSILFLFRVLQT